MTRLGDDFVHLESWQLSAFTGLSALCHFDLYLFGIYQIFRCHTERPLATCFVLLLRLMPSTVAWKRSASSPPSPVFERPPSLFIAKQMASCASFESAPNDIAPATKVLDYLLYRLYLIDADW